MWFGGLSILTRFQSLPMFSSTTTCDPPDTTRGCSRWEASASLCRTWRPWAAGRWTLRARWVCRLAGPCRRRCGWSWCTLCVPRYRTLCTCSLGRTGLCNVGEPPKIIIIDRYPNCIRKHILCLLMQCWRGVLWRNFSSSQDLRSLIYALI